jgi:protein O-mannosyl-transferase
MAKVTQLPVPARFVLSALLVLVAAIWPYRGVGKNGFVYDDVAIVQENLRVQDLRHVGEIFRTEYWNNPAIPSKLYRPVTLLSYAVERSLWGPAPGHYHRVNVALHALASLLVAALAALLLSRAENGGEKEGRAREAHASLAPELLASATLAGVLFAVHPLHSEVVAGIVGRAELLATLGVLGTIGALALGGRWRWVASPVVFMALLSKETATLVLPGVLLAHLVTPTPPSRRSHRSSLGRTLLGIAPGIAVAVILRAWALRGVPAPPVSFADNPMATTALSTRFATACAVFARYLLLHLWPARLSPDYSFRAVMPVSFTSPIALAGLALLLGFALASFVCLARSATVSRPAPRIPQSPGLELAPGLRRLVGFGLAWYVIGMLLVGNFFLVIGTGMAERLTYLPGVGLFLAGAAAARWAFAPRAPRVRNLLVGGLLALAVAAVAVSVPRCEDRARAWRNPHALFAQAVIDQPESYRVWAALGEQQMKEGRLADARSSLQRAETIYDRCADAEADLLSVEQDLGDLEAAKATARRIISLSPGDARPRCILALLLAREGNVVEARREAEAGLALNAGWRPLRLVLGRLATAAGDRDEAARQYAQALSGGTDTTRVMREMAPLLVRLSCWSEAAAVYRDLFRGERDWATANAFAWSLVNLARSNPPDRARLLAEAHEAAEVAVRAAPADARKHVLDTLATVQWESGERTEAIASLESLIRECPWEDLYRRRLEVYQGALR